MNLLLALAQAAARSSLSRSLVEVAVGGVLGLAVAASAAQPTPATGSSRMGGATAVPAPSPTPALPVPATEQPDFSVWEGYMLRGFRETSRNDARIVFMFDGPNGKRASLRLLPRRADADPAATMAAAWKAELGDRRPVSQPEEERFVLADGAIRVHRRSGGHGDTDRVLASFVEVWSSQGATWQAVIASDDESTFIAAVEAYAIALQQRWMRPVQPTAAQPAPPAGPQDGLPPVMPALVVGQVQPPPPPVAPAKLNRPQPRAPQNGLINLRMPQAENPREQVRLFAQRQSGLLNVAAAVPLALPAVLQGQRREAPDFRNQANALRADPGLVGPAGYANLAATHLARADLGGALLVLTAAQERWPSDANTLINLAGLLLVAQRPNEALSVLAALEGRQGELKGDWPAPGPARWTYLRAYALAATGDFATAERLLQGVCGRYPAFSEACELLAALALGRGDEGAAARAWALSRWRMVGVNDASTGLPLHGSSPPPERVGFEPMQAIDFTRGADLPDPGVPIPRNYEQAVSWRLNKEVEQIRAAEMVERNSPVLLETIAASRRPSTQRQYEYALQAIKLIDAGLRPLRQQQSNTEAALQAAWVFHFARHTAGLKAPGLMRADVHAAEERASFSRYLAELVPYIESAFAASHTVAAHRYRGLTALGHGIGSPAVRAWLQSQADLVGLELNMRQRYLIAPLIAAAPRSPRETTPGRIDRAFAWTAAKLAPCDPEDDRLSSSGNLNPPKPKPKLSLSVEFNCSGLSLEIKTPGVLALSAEAAMTYSGDTSIFISDKADLGVGTAAYGFYMRRSAKGVRDFGMKHEIKGGLSARGFAGAYKIDELEYSFLPALRGDGGEEDPNSLAR